LHVFSFKCYVGWQALELTDHTVGSSSKEGNFAMEILVAILAIVGVGLGYRYWRARTAH
jgi:hypothetical protein